MISTNVVPASVTVPAAALSKRRAPEAVRPKSMSLSELAAARGLVQGRTPEVAAPEPVEATYNIPSIPSPSAPAPAGASVATGSELSTPSDSADADEQGERCSCPLYINTVTQPGSTESSAFHSGDKNGTIPGEYSHIPSVYKERIIGGVDVSALVPALVSTPVSAPEPVSALVSNSYAKLMQAQREHRAALVQAYPDAYSLTNAEYAGVLRSIIDSAWNGTEQSSRSALSFVPTDKLNAVLNRPNQLRRTRKALQANAMHPALQELVRRHGKRGLGGLADTSLSKCIQGIRRSISNIRGLYLQQQEIDSMKQTLREHELRIAELEARLGASANRSTTPLKMERGTERNADRKLEQKARVLTMIQQGRSYADIAQLESIGKGTISRWFNASQAH